MSWTIHNTIGHPLMGFASIFSDKWGEWIHDVTLPGRIYDAKKATAIIDSVGLAKLNKYHVWAPEGLNGSLLEYATVNTDIMKVLGDVKKNYLLPLQLWAGNMISDKGYPDKGWIELLITETTVDSSIQSLAEIIKASTNDEPYSTPLPEVYPGKEDLLTCAYLSDELNEGVAKHFGPELVNEVNKTYMATNAILTGKYSDRLNEASRENQQLLKAFMLETAKVIELAAVLSFNAKLLSVTSDKNITKILDELAE